MKTAAHKTTFATRLGIIFATAGSAVGLGNIWHFPTTCGQNGGAAFVLLYLVITIALGVPGMMGEFIIGRNGGKDPVFSYRKAGGKRLFGLIGMAGVMGGSLILGFYSVVAGWCVYYLALALSDGVLGSPAHISATFSRLMAPDNYVPLVLTVVFILLTHIIIVRGVRKGIEVASKIMVPTLIVLLLMLICASCTLPRAWDGIRFLFYPDFTKLNAHVVFKALGEAFFSLSLGTACLCTYASYFREETNLFKSTAQIAFIDMGVALMAGLMIFPAAFSAGVEPDAGPSLVFMTMPNVFAQAFPHTVAYVVSTVFYLLLTIAALTSTISMHEIGTAVLSQETPLSRAKAAWVVTLFCSAIGLLSAYSLSHEGWGLFGDTFFDNFDKLTANIMLPLGALSTLLVVGWVMPRKVVIRQLTSRGRYRWKRWGVELLYVLMRFVCPMMIVCILIDKLTN
ncbi:MAG: sodium-dependent transporter [Prevotella sp.]|nr:sodium-dependent transporter [Prevotella sp.]